MFCSSQYITAELTNDEVIARNTTVPQSTSDLFNGGEPFTNSEDYIIDLWAEGDPLIIYPVDVQQYLIIMGRTDAILDKYQGYERMRACIKNGIATLLRLKEEGKGLFFDPKHKFSDKAFKKFPHYPWLYGLPCERIYVLLDDSRNMTWSGGFEFDKTEVIYSNVRVPLPPNLRVATDRWNDVICDVYGGLSPFSYRSNKWGTPDKGIRLRIHQILASRTGSDWPAEILPLPLNPSDDEWDYEWEDEYGKTDDEDEFYSY